VIVQVLIELFNRDITRCIKEIEAFKTEENIWRTYAGINNSAGNLCLHLIGNLNTYIGEQISKTGYIRDRELEFSSKGIPKADLVKGLESTLDVVVESLNKMNQRDLEKEYPLLVFKEKTSTLFFITHLSTHLNYHLGQINYLRRNLEP
jgi:hypothetical protein